MNEREFRDPTGIYPGDASLPEVLAFCLEALGPFMDLDDDLSRLCNDEEPTPRGWLTHGMVRKCSVAYQHLKHCVDAQGGAGKSR